MTRWNIGARILLPPLLLLTAGCEPPALEEVPTELLGRWTTTDARYADRAFEITPETFYLGQGDDRFVSYTILRIRIIPRRDKSPVHSVEYRDESGDETAFQFLVSDEQGGTIRFPNQRELVWRRNPDAEVPWEVVLQPR
ncbi:MAG: hypothetical protein BMS9Abin29_0239 [Gemmatimonadota bacterium]|nr:MAG: hypothetical protein BMS9Abin29_0239 [Gemmatimonadota bacterium]